VTRTGDELDIERTHRKRRDVVVAVIASIVADGVIAAIVRTGQIHLTLGVAILVQEVPLVVVLVVLMTKWDWWSRAGWRRPDVSKLWLAWFPALPVAAQIGAFVTFVSRHSVGSIAVAAVAACTVGFTEESWFRGLLFGALESRGVLYGALVSSIVFGLLHSSWLVSGATAARTLQEIATAFGIGMMFVAVRYRTRSIWPVVILHAATDFPGLLLTKHQMLTGGADVRGTLVIVGVGALYALILLRPRTRQSL
jgi:membrane protease YdiL (CAAX protease family)